MNHPLTLRLDQTQAEVPGYRFALQLRNDSAVKLLLPFPEIIGLHFWSTIAATPAEWYTSILYSGAGGALTLLPGQRREFDFCVRSSKEEQPKSDDFSDYVLWYVDLEGEAYDVEYRFGVNSAYFDPHSHWQLPQLEELAAAEAANVWLGEATSPRCGLLGAAHSGVSWPAAVVQLAHALQTGDDCLFALHDALLEAGQADLAGHFREERWHAKNCLALQRILTGEPSGVSRRVR